VTHPAQDAPVTMSMPISITKGFMGMGGNDQATVSFVLPKIHYFAGEMVRFKVICDNTKVPKAIEKIKVTLNLVTEYMGNISSITVGEIRRMEQVPASALKEQEGFFQLPLIRPFDKKD